MAISIERFEELEHKVTVLTAVVASLQTHVQENRQFLHKLSGSCVRDAEDTLLMHDIVKTTAVDVVALRMELSALREDLGRSKCQPSIMNISTAPSACSDALVWTVPWGFVR